MHVTIPAFVTGATKERKERKFHECATDRDVAGAPKRVYRIDVPVEIEEVAASDLDVAAEVTGRDRWGVPVDERFLGRGGATYAPVRRPDTITRQGAFENKRRGHAVASGDFASALAGGVPAWPPVDGEPWPYGFDPDERGWMAAIPTPEEAEVREFRDGGLVARAETDARAMAASLLSVDGVLHAATPPPLLRVSSHRCGAVSTLSSDLDGDTALHHPDERDWMMDEHDLVDCPTVVVHDPSVYVGVRSAEALRVRAAVRCLTRAAERLRDRRTPVPGDPAAARAADEASRTVAALGRGEAVDPGPALRSVASALADAPPLPWEDDRCPHRRAAPVHALLSRLDAHAASPALDALVGPSFAGIAS